MDPMTFTVRTIRYDNDGTSVTLHMGRVGNSSEHMGRAAEIQLVNCVPLPFRPGDVVYLRMEHAPELNQDPQGGTLIPALKKGGLL